MVHPIRVLRVASAGIILLAASCSTAASTVTGPVEGAFRLVSARVTPGEIEMLDITAELTNAGTVPLRSGGCLRPDLAIDFAAPGADRARRAPDGGARAVYSGVHARAGRLAAVHDGVPSQARL